MAGLAAQQSTLGIAISHLVLQLINISADLNNNKPKGLKVVKEKLRSIGLMVNELDG